MICIVFSYNIYKSCVYNIVHVIIVLIWVSNWFQQKYSCLNKNHILSHLYRKILPHYARFLNCGEIILLDAI